VQLRQDVRFMRLLQLPNLNVAGSIPVSRPYFEVFASAANVSLSIKFSREDTENGAQVIRLSAISVAM
jgi:hypothetical protein